ncbi:MAG: radical SAM protein [Euryarchaeota archaeon]|nr:radical SAM protein [Euryarchaeota archaeon]
MNSYKVYIDSTAWICETNLVGTSRIYRYMLENGHEVIKDPSKADFIIINSCGLTKMRRDLSIEFFEKYYSQRKETAKIIMFGCLVKIDGEKVNSLDLIPIDFNEGYKFDEIFYTKIKFETICPHCDNITKETLLQGKNLFQSTRIIPFVLSGLLFPFFKKARLNYQKMIDSITYKDKIFVEIARGCTGNCSYCMIKKARGNIHSRKIEDILSDIEKLYDPSKNLFLVADDCGSYGIDIKTNLFDLLYEIKKRYPDVTVDLNYINPYWLERYPDEYVKLFRDVKINLASIPVQSGSNKVLKIMNRRYDINKVVEVVKRIKQVSPQTITYSHFLIAFPGENIIDFLKTLYCTKYFDFPIGLTYSEHKDSASSKLDNHKSSLTITLRYIVFLLFINLILSYKLLIYPSE